MKILYIYNYVLYSMILSKSMVFMFLHVIVLEIINHIEYNNNLTLRYVKIEKETAIEILESDKLL